MRPNKIRLKAATRLLATDPKASRLVLDDANPEDEVPIGKPIDESIQVAPPSQPAYATAVKGK